MQEAFRVPKSNRIDGKVPPEDVRADDQQFVLIDVAGARIAEEKQPQSDTAEAKEPPLPDMPSAYAETSMDERNAVPESPSVYANPAPFVSSPLLAAVAGAALLLAGWSYSSLQTAEAQLSSLIAAKASADRALADAQSRLAAAETAIAGVKSALTSPASGAAATPEAAKP